MNLEILNRHRRKVVCVLILRPLFFAVSCASDTWQTFSFLQKAQSAAGTVVAVVPETTTSSTSSSFGASSRRETTVYRSRVAFVDAEGQSRQINSQWASFPAMHSVGDAVQVVYDPASPDDARIKGVFTIWGEPLITALVVVVSVLVLWAMDRYGFQPSRWRRG